MMAYALPDDFWTVPSLSWLPRKKAVRRHRPMQTRLNEQAPRDAAQLNALLVDVGRLRDRAAFEALFNHFAPRVKAYLLRLGAHGAQADELAQEALLLLWRKAEQFDPAKASAATWIFTIARNLRIDAVRRERRPEIDPDDPAFVSEPEPQADAGISRDQEDTRLRAAIARLPAEQAQVLQLSFFADKPHSAIASELGLPLGTVKSRLRLAMRRIRVTLEGES